MGLFGVSHVQPGAEGSVRIAPPIPPSQGDSGILPLSIPARSPTIAKRDLVASRTRPARDV